MAAIIFLSIVPGAYETSTEHPTGVSYASPGS